MKKLLSILICILFLVGCSDKATFTGDATCADIMQAAVDATNAPDYDNIYRYDDENFDSLTMALWAYGLYEECSEYDLIEDCAIYVGAGNITYEVGVIKPKEVTDTEKIEQLFSRRKETMSAGNKAAYDPNFSSLIDDSLIYTDGEFVILLITNDNTLAKDAINGLKK